MALAPTTLGQLILGHFDLGRRSSPAREADAWLELVAKALQASAGAVMHVTRRPDRDVVTLLSAYRDGKAGVLDVSVLDDAAELRESARSLAQSNQGVAESRSHRYGPWISTLHGHIVEWLAQMPGKIDVDAATAVLPAQFGLRGLRPPALSVCGRPVNGNPEVLTIAVLVLPVGDANAGRVLRIVHRAMADRLAQAGAHTELAADLSVGERQTLSLLLTGKSEKQVAVLLGRSQHTVHGYVKRI
ncbi:MAG: hypothetical protein QM770_19530 [Tepidisphaeraceae bacterium]